MSAKRLEDRPRRQAETAAVMERDGSRCVMTDHSPCFGSPTPHHLKKASAGGKHHRDNLVVLCEHHQTVVEDEPDMAYALGLVIRSGGSEEEAAMRRKRLLPEHRET